MSHHVEIPTSPVSIFKFGREFALLSRFTQSQLAKSFAIIL